MESGASQSDNKEEPVTKNLDVVEVMEPSIIPVITTTSNTSLSLFDKELNENCKNSTIKASPSNNVGAQQTTTSRSVKVPSTTANNNVVTKRKMSTMVEEDSSDDLDNCCPNR